MVLLNPYISISIAHLFPITPPATTSFHQGACYPPKQEAVCLVTKSVCLESRFKPQSSSLTSLSFNFFLHEGGIITACCRRLNGGLDVTTSNKCSQNYSDHNNRRFYYSQIHISRPQAVTFLVSHRRRSHSSLLPA